MTDIILGIDPGQATGWSIWALDDDAPIQRLDCGLIPGGSDGFMAWAVDHIGAHITLIPCEQFDPKAGDAIAAAKDYEAMWVQGCVKAIAWERHIEVAWQPRNMKAMCRDETLKEHGLWIDGPEVDWEDGRDVNDSQIHVLAWAKANGHEPTLEHYWPPQ